MYRCLKVFIASLSIISAIYITASFAGWTTDGAPVCVYSGEQEYPVICSDGSGGAFIAWEDVRDYRDIYAQRIDGMGRRQWTIEGLAVCTASYSQTGPRICSDGSGGTIIAWTDPRASNVGDIYAQRISSAGTLLWTSDGAPVCTEDANQYLYGMCGDGFGGALLVWQDERVSSSYDDIYCQRIDADGNVLWSAAGVPLSTGISYLREEPQVVADGSGGGIFTWIDWGSGGIFAQRVNSTGEVQWVMNGVTICNASGYEYEPKITTDGYGGAIITWYDHRSWYDIYVQRVDSLGNVMWTANGVQLTDDGAEDIWQAYARICPDYDGGAVVAWTDLRDGNNDCYAQRVNGDGIPQWSANGIPISVAPGSGNEISMLPASDKSVILAWEDNRSGTGKDIYVQRVDSLGVVQWDLNGIAACAADGYQLLPQIASDGADGAIITWQDERVFMDPDIYARRITDEGEYVATLLHSYCAEPRETGIIVEWRLSEIDAGICFNLKRAESGTGEYISLPPGGIESDGFAFSYLDTSCLPGTAYIYRVEVETQDNSFLLFETDPVTPDASALSLYQNYPNPFNPVTSIGYFLPVNCHVTLVVYDISGREVCRIFDGDQAAGTQLVTWPGIDNSGNPVRSGVYLYRLQAGKDTISRKMILLE
jgi:hypothetical protein